MTEVTVHFQAEKDVAGDKSGRIKFRCGRVNFEGCQHTYDWKLVTCGSCLYFGGRIRGGGYLGTIPSES